jgi:hypothetical protein
MSYNKLSEKIRWNIEKIIESTTYPSSINIDNDKLDS